MKFLLDENFNNKILRGVRRRIPDYDTEFDFVRAQDIPAIYGQDDPTVLAWAASNGRILLTHDIDTIPGFVFERIDKGLQMPGVIVVPDHTPIGAVIEDILIVIIAGRPEDFDSQVRYIPL